MSSLDKWYKIRYHANEIRLVVTDVPCMCPTACACAIPGMKGPKCCYTAEEARAFIVQYYMQRAFDAKHQPIEEFIKEFGIEDAGHS